jgi:predicted transposase YbfD/YdcC
VLVDAGITSRDNAQCVLNAHKHYLFALKENHRGLFQKAQALLSQAVSLETTRERYRGKSIVRHLYCAPSIQGLAYPGLTQLIKIVQETFRESKLESVEERIFLTSIPEHKLASLKLMNLIRLHWGIENGPNWTMDMYFKEDTHCPCKKNYGPLVLSFLTVMAYNLTSIIRKTLSTASKTAISWHRSMEQIYHFFILSQVESFHPYTV